LELVFSSPRSVERACHSWLRQPIDAFLGHLADQRYNKGTLLHYASWILDFGEFAARQGLNDLRQLPQCIEPFVAQLQARTASASKWRSLLTRFIEYLQRRQIIPVPLPPPPSEQTVLVEGYLQVLREQRGLCERTLEVRRRLCRTLMAYLATEGISDLHALRADVLHRFIACRGKRCNRPALQGDCSVLRDFLSFLRRRGILSWDLAAAVPSPRRCRHERCPQFLTRSEIEAVLAWIAHLAPKRID
jgi:site-specific recombinase XerC